MMGWIEYLRMDDEERANWTAYAMTKAFQGGPRKQAVSQAIDDDEEEVIDTTSPDFIKNFKGFTNAPIAPQRTLGGIHNTEILRG